MAAFRQPAMPLNGPLNLAVFLLYSTLLLPSLASAQAAPTTTIVTTAPTTQPSQSPQFVQDGLFQQAVLNSTNFYRSEHNATALTWNSSLADFGTNWVEACNFAHSGGPDGENLAEGYTTATDSIDAWGDERAQYDFSNPGFSEKTGHFTQLVWKATTTVGCGRKYCAGQNGLTGWYLTCEYWPRGNVIGQFQTQVQSQVNGTPSGLGGSGSGNCVQGTVCNAGGRAAGTPMISATWLVGLLAVVASWSW